MSGSDATVGSHIDQRGVAWAGPNQHHWQSGFQVSEAAGLYPQRCQDHAGAGRKGSTGGRTVSWFRKKKKETGEVAAVVGGTYVEQEKLPDPVFSQE